MPSPRRVRPLPVLCLAGLFGASLPAAAGVAVESSEAPAEWSVELDTPYVVDGILLPAASVVRFASTPRHRERVGPERPGVVKVTPSEPLVLWGMTAAAGEELYLGPFVSLTLAAEATVDGLALEAGSVVEFERRADVPVADVRGVKVVRGGTLARAATVRGVLLPGGTAVEFLPDGGLWRARLLDDDEVNGLPVSADEEMTFHPNGRPASWQPSRDVAVDGRRCSGGGEVRQFPSGRLERCTLVDEVMVGGVVVSDEEPTTFFESGALAEATLGATLLRDDHVLVEGARVAFHPNGRLRRVRSPERPDAASPELEAAPQRIRGIPLVPLPDRTDDGAYFRPDGTLERVLTGADFEFDGVPVAGARGPVEFRVSGRLKSARLSRDALVQGRPRQRGEFVRLGRGEGGHGKTPADSLRPAENR
jgi:hypothetical protein